MGQTSTHTHEAGTDAAAAAEVPATMRAVVQDRYGDADVLRLAEVAVPSVGDDEVLVRVAAAGLDRGTWHLMAGLPYMVRPMFGFRRPRQPVLGMDLAGTVVAVGSAVTRFSVGDEVFGVGTGTFAELAVAPERKLAHRPDALGPEQAAVTAISGMTALQGLRDVGRLEPGQRVLVIGASGGVGSFAVQIAKAMGAHVTGVASAAKLDLVRSLGADEVIDYTRHEVTEGPDRFDLILDIGGNRPVRRLRRILTERGTLVVVGGEGGGRWTGGTGRQLRAMLWSPFVRQRLTTFISKESHTDVERLAELAVEGAVVPQVGRVYPLAEAPVAMRHLVAGEVRGKVAIVP